MRRSCAQESGVAGNALAERVEIVGIEHLLGSVVRRDPSVRLLGCGAGSRGAGAATRCAGRPPPATWPSACSSAPDRGGRRGDEWSADVGLGDESQLDGTAEMTA